MFSLITSGFIAFLFTFLSNQQTLNCTFGGLSLMNVIEFNTEFINSPFNTEF